MLIGYFSNIHGNLCSFAFHKFSKPFILLFYYFMCSNYSFIFSIICVHLFQNLKFSPICFSWLSFLFILRHCSSFPLHLYLWLCVDHFKIYLCRVCLSTTTVLLGALAVQNSFKVIWQLVLFRTFQNIQVVSLHGGWFNSSPCFHRGCITLHIPSFWDEVNAQSGLQAFYLPPFYPEWCSEPVPIYWGLLSKRRKGCFAV